MDDSLNMKSFNYPVWILWLIYFIFYREFEAVVFLYLNLFPMNNLLIAISNIKICIDILQKLK